MQETTQQQDQQQEVQITNYELFIQSCNLFNKLADKDNKATILDLKQQLALISEELNETIRDLDAKNYVGVLDGYTDIAVTWAGLGMMLDSQGFNTKDALLDTANNNLTKFVAKDDSEEIISTIGKYSQEGITAELNAEYGFYAFKDINNKVKKPFSFVSNDLTKHVPTNLYIVPTNLYIPEGGD
jgi:hypothetical protein